MRSILMLVNRAARSKIRGNQRDFADEGRNVAIDNLAAGRVRIKGTVLAFVRAEGHMNIKAADRFRRAHGHEPPIAQSTAWDNQFRSVRAKARISGALAGAERCELSSLSRC